MCLCFLATTYVFTLMCQLLACLCVCIYSICVFVDVCVCVCVSTVCVCLWMCVFVCVYIQYVCVCGCVSHLKSVCHPLSLLQHFILFIPPPGAAHIAGRLPDAAPCSTISTVLPVNCERIESPLPLPFPSPRPSPSVSSLHCPHLCECVFSLSHFDVLILLLFWTNKTNKSLKVLPI